MLLTFCRNQNRGWDIRGNWFTCAPVRPWCVYLERIAYRSCRRHNRTSRVAFVLLISYRSSWTSCSWSRFWTCCDSLDNFISSSSTTRSVRCNWVSVGFCSSWSCGWVCSRSAGIEGWWCWWLRGRSSVIKGCCCCWSLASMRRCRPSWWSRSPASRGWWRSSVQKTC